MKYKKEEETKKEKEIKKEKKEKKEIEKQKTNIHPVVKSAKLCGLKIYVRSTSSNTYLNDGGEYEVAQNVTYLCQGVDGIVCTSNAIKHVTKAKHKIIKYQNRIPKEEKKEEHKKEQKKEIKKESKRFQNSTPVAIVTKRKVKHSFSPQRPILKRNYMHTAPSPRFIKGLHNKWSAKNVNPIEYKNGMKRIYKYNNKKKSTTIKKNARRRPAETFFQNGRRVKTPKEKIVERNNCTNGYSRGSNSRGSSNGGGERTWILRPPPTKSGFNDVLMFFSTLSNSWKTQNNGNLANLNMNIKK